MTIPFLLFSGLIITLPSYCLELHVLPLKNLDNYDLIPQYSLFRILFQKGIILDECLRYWASILIEVKIQENNKMKVMTRHSHFLITTF